MDQFYFWCAAIAGSLFVVQTMLTLVGLGNTDLDVDVGDLDLDIGEIDLDGGDINSGNINHSAAADAHFVGMLSIKAIIAGVTVFGLTGLAAGRQLDTTQTVLIAMLAAGFTMYAVGWVIHKMHQLNSDGTVHIGQCVGTIGSVYLKVPGSKGGVGKVTVEIQGRTMEYSAVTAGQVLPTGSKVTVCGILSNDTLIVQAN